MTSATGLETMSWLGEDTEAWDRFWRAGHRACCYQDEQGRYLPPIRERWQDLFFRLAPGARVLDVGTGNGAVPSEAVDYCQDHPGARLAVDAFDFADIQPPVESSDSCSVEFHPRVDCRSLPFADQSFDALTAQFALEYLPLAEAATELARVARVGARFRAVLHVKGGVSEHLACQETEEVDALVHSQLFARVREIIDEPSEPRIAHLRQVALGLSAKTPPTATLTPMVLNNLERLYSHREASGPGPVLAAVDTLFEELAAHRRRLEQLCGGAVDGPRQEVIAGNLTQAGFEPPQFQPIRVAGSGTLLAMQMDTRRS